MTLFFFYSLYGGAQSELLPYDSFQWMTKEEIDSTDFLSLDAEGKVGCSLEVDMSYPETLHEAHDNYPLCPESFSIRFSDLSPFSQKCFVENEGHENYESEKLTATFTDKKSVVLSLKNLQLYCSLGMKLKKVHRVVKYRQRKFLKPYIDLCTKARKKSNSDFKKNMYKLLANAVYGKFIQDPRKYAKVHLAKSRKQALKEVSSPLYKSHAIISKDLISFCLSIKEIVLDKPFPVGFMVLEHSKHFMYDFWYNKLKPIFGEKLDLLFTDTDSFCFALHCKETYFEAMQKMSPYFDFSNYPPQNSLYSKKHEKALGFFKDELGGKKSISKFCGLRSKCYAMLFADKTEKLTCKGVGKTIVKNKMHFSQYLKVLKTNCVLRETFPVIESSNHQISTVQRRKKALSNFDSKRFILPCGIHSYPFGSILISKFKGECSKCKLKKSKINFF